MILTKVEHKTTRDWSSLGMTNRFKTTTTVTISSRMGLEGELTLQTTWNNESSAAAHALELLSQLGEQLALDLQEEYYKAKEAMLLKRIEDLGHDLDDANNYIKELEAKQNGPGSDTN